MFQSQRRTLVAALRATGQTTVYAVGDDGHYQKGVKPNQGIVLTAGQYAGTTNIVLNGKTDVHSNNCVIDLHTSLMWSRVASASVGPAADGNLPFTVNGAGEGIFEYANAANLAGLAGFSDWRVPNRRELDSLMIYELPFVVPDATMFPTFSGAVFYATSTTQPFTIANYYVYVPVTGQIVEVAKVIPTTVMLVRDVLEGM